MIMIRSKRATSPTPPHSPRTSIFFNSINPSDSLFNALAFAPTSTEYDTVFEIRPFSFSPVLDPAPAKAERAAVLLEAPVAVRYGRAVEESWVVFAPGRMRTKSARLVGRQAQIMAIWHSITDQWFRGSISTVFVFLLVRFVCG